MPDTLDPALEAALVAFTDFLNEPPEYEGALRVREYRHEAYSRWVLVLDAIHRASPQAEIDRLREARLSVCLESGQLVIRIGLDVLANAIMFAPSLNHFDETVSDDVLEPTITDADKFFKEVVLALEREEEDGTTPVHRLLDAAALDAIENGAEGIETGWDKADKLRADLSALHPETPNGGHNG